MGGNQRNLLRQIFGIPRTSKGRLSFYLCIAFFFLFGIWLSFIELRFRGFIPDRTWVMHNDDFFFPNPINYVLIAGSASAIVGAFVGGFSLIFGRERSILTVVSCIVGVFVLYWSVAEMIGH